MPSCLIDILSDQARELDKSIGEGSDDAGVLFETARQIEESLK
jgi:hypothetical protein